MIDQVPASVTTSVRKKVFNLHGLHDLSAFLASPTESKIILLKADLPFSS